MRYHVLATDYDGTLATHGQVDSNTVEALEALLATGRRLVMVTGRELPELEQIFPHLALFEWVVAENGALLYHPATKESFTIADPPPAKFIDALRDEGCQPMSVGRVIVATWEPHQQTVLKNIQNFGLELQVIFNKGAVMVLPAGVNKAAGLAAALAKMGMSAHNAVGVGDAENDHAMLKACEFSAAVSNALPALKETADWVTPDDHGAGVAQLIRQMVANDLQDWDERLTRHHLELGVNLEGGAVALPPYGPSVLIAGPSASGKSTVATRFVETLAEQKYQFCLIDPEGDYENFEQAVVLGGPKAAPQLPEVLKLLEDPKTSVIVSMTGMPIADRPPFFLKLLPHLMQMRARSGRPHWLILDEAHHLLPAKWIPSADLLPDDLNSLVMITVHPDLLAPAILERMDTLFATGPEADATLRMFVDSIKSPHPEITGNPLEKGQVLYWRRKGPAPQVVKMHPSKQERRRHRRKYAEGELSPERSFFFQGPEQKLNLRAQNLILFLQLADGVDDATWEYHRKDRGYSQWIRTSIKDDDLAAAVERIERDESLDPQESRRQIRAAVERDYTLPGTAPLPVPGAG